MRASIKRQRSASNVFSDFRYVLTGILWLLAPNPIIGWLDVGKTFLRSVEVSRHGFFFILLDSSF